MTTADRLHTFLRHVDETFSCITIKLFQFQIWSCVLKQPYSEIVNWGFLQIADNTNSDRQITSIGIKNCVAKTVQQAMLWLSVRKRCHAATMQSINSKLFPPLGCWFWVVPRSMLLEAFTCWNCHWYWPGVWGWAEEEPWEGSLG